MAAHAALKYRRSGGVVPTSTVHKVLRNRLYMGEFDLTADSIRVGTCRS